MLRFPSFCSTGAKPKLSVAWKAFFVTAASSAGLLYLRRKQSGESKILIGTPKIGAPFRLRNQSGNLIDSETAFRGKLRLMYFGFTHCPDVCPDELDRMGRVLERLQKENSKIFNSVVPIFVTCDPKRDTPRVVAEYLEEFHPKIVGLTGTPEEVAVVTKAYHVYSAVNPTGASEDGEDYLVDHSTITYLCAPDGAFIRHFSRSDSDSTVIDGIKEAYKENFSWFKKILNR